MGDERGVEWLKLSHEEFARKLGEVYSVQGDLPRLEGIAQVRAALEAERNATAQKSTAKWTRALVIVTGLLVAMTATFSYRAMAAQEDTLHELRRQNCLAEIDLKFGLVSEGVRLPPEALTALQNVVSACS